jgi:hypothetical protein
MSGLEDFRAQYPEYDDMDDTTLAGKLYEAHYSDMSRDEFDLKLGLQSATPDTEGGFDPIGSFTTGAKTTASGLVELAKGIPSFVTETLPEYAKDVYYEAQHPSVQASGPAALPMALLRPLLPDKEDVTLGMVEKGIHGTGRAASEIAGGLLGTPGGPAGNVAGAAVGGATFDNIVNVIKGALTDEEIPSFSDMGNLYAERLGEYAVAEPIARLGGKVLVRKPSPGLEAGTEKIAKKMEKVGMGIRSGDWKKQLKKHYDVIEDVDTKKKRVVTDLDEAIDTAEADDFLKGFPDEEEMLIRAHEKVEGYYSDLNDLFDKLDNVDDPLVVQTTRMDKQFKKKTPPHKKETPTGEEAGEIANIKDTYSNRTYDSIRDAVDDKVSVYEDINWDVDGKTLNGMKKAAGLDIRDSIKAYAKEHLTPEEFVRFETAYKKLSAYHELGPILQHSLGEARSRTIIDKAIRMGRIFSPTFGFGGIGYVMGSPGAGLAMGATLSAAASKPGSKAIGKAIRGIGKLPVGAVDPTRPVVTGLVGAAREAEAPNVEQNAQALVSGLTNNTTVGGDSKKKMTEQTPLYNALTGAETGPKTEATPVASEKRFIRTKVGGPRRRKSSAYGPVQITGTLAKEMIRRKVFKDDPEMLEFTKRFITQAEKFLDAKDSDPKYGLGGEGDMNNPADRAMYARWAERVIQSELDSVDGDVEKFIKKWRGEADPAYVKKIKAALGRS